MGVVIVIGGGGGVGVLRRKGKGRVGFGGEGGREVGKVIWGSGEERLERRVIVGGVRGVM